MRPHCLYCGIRVIGLFMGKRPERFVTLQGAICYMIQRWTGLPVEIKKERGPREQKAQGSVRL